MQHARDRLREPKSKRRGRAELGAGLRRGEQHRRLAAREPGDGRRWRKPLPCLRDGADADRACRAEPAEHDGASWTRQVHRPRRANTRQRDLAHGPIEPHLQRRSARHPQPTGQEARPGRHQFQPRGLGSSGDPAVPARPAEDGLGEEARSRDHATRRPDGAVPPHDHRDRRSVLALERNTHEVPCETRQLHLRQPRGVESERAARPRKQRESECCREGNRQAAERPRPPPPSARGSRGE